jgi:hypothetical protein
MNYTIYSSLRYKHRSFASFIQPSLDVPQRHPRIPQSGPYNVIIFGGAMVFDFCVSYSSDDALVHMGIS